MTPTHVTDRVFSALPNPAHCSTIRLLLSGIDLETYIRKSLLQYYLHVAYWFEEAKAAEYLVEFCHPRTPQAAYIFRPKPHTLHFTLHIIRLSGQPKPCGGQDRIPRLIKPKLELLTLLVISVLAGERNRPGMPIHRNTLLVIPNLSTALIGPELGIPLVIQITNLTMKRQTMLNSVPVKYPM